MLQALVEKKLLPIRRWMITRRNSGTYGRDNQWRRRGMKDRQRSRKNARPTLRGELIATVWRNIGTGFRRAQRCRIWRWRCGMRGARDGRRRRTQYRRRGTWRRNWSPSSRAVGSHFLSTLTTTRATRFDNHCDRALRVLAEFEVPDRSIWR